METRYCIEYINPQYPLRDDGSLNVRYDRVLTLEQAEHDLTLILSFGGKILDLYMGNVVDGETGEWSPKPMIIDDDDWFSTKWLNTLEVKDVQEEPVSQDLCEYINELSKQFPEVSFAKLSRIAVRVAKWKGQQMMSKAIVREVKVDAGGYPYIDATELYDYDKDMPLAKEGDKVKVIILNDE